MPVDSKVIIDLLLATWNGQISRTTEMFDSLTDEDLQQQISPDRNTGVYLLGHLIATHDSMLYVLGVGEALYPELTKNFIEQPDGENTHSYNITDLRTKWNAVNTLLNEKLSALSAEDWLQRHTLVSEDAFSRQPHRNKLNVLISRTSHASYHTGQLVLLKKR